MNVPIPYYEICNNENAYSAAITNYGFPIVVKPSDNSGSRGVSYVKSKENAALAYKYARDNSLDKLVIVEEFMEGKEVSVEAFVCEGRVIIVQITDKITTGAPHFVEMGHSQPSALDEAVIHDIKDVTIKAINALEIKGGPVHVEIIVTNDGAKIVELGARLGGDFIATNLVPLSTGVDLVAATINWALGKDVDLQSRDNKFAAIRYLSNLENVHFNNEIIKELEYFSWNRLSVNELKSSRDREGLFIVSDITREKMEEKIEKIRDSIHCNVENLFW